MFRHGIESVRVAHGYLHDYMTKIMCTRITFVSLGGGGAAGSCTIATRAWTDSLVNLEAQQPERHAGVMLHRRVVTSSRVHAAEPVNAEVST